ncbi:SRPBCC family protein [Mucilaginibacter antarcticus]|uniref:SRPBCC family protein n=1 Tax=Mucilaginibacter antarcticus TaxID=1855725 RepID=UPI003645BC52
MNAQPFVIEQTYNWPIEKVWSALTDNEKLKQWYFKLDDFKPEVGFAFRFSGTDKGVTFWHRCVVTEATPPNKLAHTWTYEEFPGESVVTWELFDEGVKPALSLLIQGWRLSLKITHHSPQQASAKAGLTLPAKV